MERAGRLPPGLRMAEPADADALALILEERDRFYDVAGVVPIDERAIQIRATLFAPQVPACVLLGLSEGGVAGLASYSFLWPAAGMTSSLYLKELFVTDSHRGRGVGRVLMAGLQQIAATHGCSRIEWTTDRHNTSAQAFYQRLGFEIETSKLFYRVVM